MKLEKTAIEWLLNQFENKGYVSLQDELQAKEIFKNQIQNAFYRGIQEQTQRALFKNPEITSPEEYYKKTFKKL